MQSKDNKINDEYRKFLTTKADDWSSSGRLYAITGRINCESDNHKLIWDKKRSDVIYFFNKFQRQLTGTRYWKKEKHKQVQVLLLPESASMLHYHGIICIPHYCFDHSNISNIELKEMAIYLQYEILHKKIFRNSCDIKPIASISGWIRYATKEYNLKNTTFSMDDILILPE